MEKLVPQSLQHVQTEIKQVQQQQKKTNNKLINNEPTPAFD